MCSRRIDGSGTGNKLDLEPSFKDGFCGASFRGLFADDTPLDAVVIATPTDTHADVVGVALAAGVHVLCEKPLAYDVSQARDLARRIRAAGRVGKMGFLFRYSPAAQYLKVRVD